MIKSPQIENGFVKIATELYGALAQFRMSGEARQVFDAILLKTYGFNKKEDAIALTQLSDLTGLPTSDVCRALKKLLSIKLIGKKASRGMNVWHVNKHYAEWIPLAKQPLAKSLVAKKTTATGNSANRLLAKSPDTINTFTKDNIQKTTSSKMKGPHPGVQSIMNAMKSCFGDLDDTEAKNRQYAWNLLRKADMNADACVSLIRAAAKLDWWKTRITKVETIYKNAHAIAKAVREQSSVLSTPKI